MSRGLEGPPSAYEYQERASSFVGRVKQEIFPPLEAQGCSCFAFTLSEPGPEDEALWDDTTADQETRQWLRQEADKFRQQLIDQGIDRGELLIEGPLAARNLLANLKPRLSELAASFRGSEHVWILKLIAHSPSQPAHLTLLASYQFALL